MHIRGVSSGPGEEGRAPGRACPVPRPLSSLHSPSQPGMVLIICTWFRQMKFGYECNSEWSVCVNVCMRAGVSECVVWV